VKDKKAREKIQEGITEDNIRKDEKESKDMVK
jgi:hypothetical protein